MGNFKMKGFSPFTQDKKDKSTMSNIDKYNYYKNKEHITDASDFKQDPYAIETVSAEEAYKAAPWWKRGFMKPPGVSYGHGPAEWVGCA